MKNLTWQNPEQLFVAQELINKVKSKCCGIKANLVFAHSLEEIDKKLSILKQMERHGNYNKLTCELHPMAYWQGDTHHDVLLTETGDEQ